MQIRTIKYGLYDMIRLKNKEFIMILYSFTPNDMNVQTILMPRVILAKFSSQKSWSLETILILHPLELR